MTKRTYKANEMQTVFDIALQFYGSVEGVAYLLIDNFTSLINKDGNFDLSQSVKIRKETINAHVLKVYDSYIPCTSGIGNNDNYLIDDNDNYLIDDNGDYLL